MTGTADHNESELRPLVAAAAWRVHFAETGETTSEAFEAWLAADPENRAAWTAVEDSWSAFGQNAGEFEVLAATRDARNTLSNSQLQYRRSAPPSWQIAAVATLIAGAGIGGMLYWQQKPLDYSTAYNQHDTVTLADGSKIMLDSSTELRVRDRGDMRDLELVRGQARFKIVHDPAHPFAVVAGARRIVDLGTKFLVRREGERLEVSLIEGRARIDLEAEGAKPQSIVLLPGDVAIASQDNIVVNKQAVAELDSEAAWRSGLLIFNHTTLGDAAREFNRYNRKQLVIADPAIARSEIFGTFRARNVELFARVAEETFGFHTRQRNGSILIER